MGNCCSDEMGHAGSHHVGPASSAASAAAADRFLRSRGAGASTQIELSLSASNLGDQEYFPKINPMVVVYSKGKEGQPEEIGRSEVILNSLNPSWSRKVSLHYQFEILQPLVFQLYNINLQFHDVSEKAGGTLSDRTESELKSALPAKAEAVVAERPPAQAEAMVAERPPALVPTPHDAGRAAQARRSGQQNPEAPAAEGVATVPRVAQAKTPMSRVAQ
ncbi:hypothetical protein PR202_ga01531 [Eleusine coracana subsp. coracana]|uniref:C2 domain-containing protein n=1 Tax=Eleusine coracana subsp. coracana TaxID=191504 RepID=A0AAV5BF83_ELECO|nr:hypothetical protein PR202_ga00844 [Eleusine coracana subsp. coracana]GJM85736.1 hypothetical protein PR202_ga01531 [Eleusine coracana subsp. coracana]